MRCVLFCVVIVLLLFNLSSTVLYCPFFCRRRHKNCRRRHLIHHFCVAGDTKKFFEKVFCEKTKSLISVFLRFRFLFFSFLKNFFVAGDKKTVYKTCRRVAGDKKNFFKKLFCVAAECIRSPLGQTEGQNSSLWRENRPPPEREEKKTRTVQIRTIQYSTKHEGIKYLYTQRCLQNGYLAEFSEKLTRSICTVILMYCCICTVHIGCNF